jgi:hypothetical protein
MLGQVRTRLVLALAAATLAVLPAAAQTAAPGDDVDPAIADGSAQRALDAARERWHATGIRSYRFRLGILCFCTVATRRPALIVVRRGKPVDPPARLRAVATVPRLLREVQQAIDDRVADLSVRYGRRGVPRTIAIDRSRMIADEEIGYDVDRFSAR